MVTVVIALLRLAAMCQGAKTLSDGSELLLDLFPTWGTVIGALLLPILGAVPDSAIIIVSGLSSIENAQQNISVGVGTLAGSTIMLLTLAWSAAMAVGRCDLNEYGEAIDRVCGPVSYDNNCRLIVRIMNA
jgi:Ca2+/Na+ antiporter